MPFPTRLGPTTLTTGQTVIKIAEQPLRLLHLLLSNYTAGSQTVTVWVLPAGVTTPADQYIILGGQVVPPNTAIPIDTDIPLAQRDRIVAMASANVAINLTALLTDEKPR